MYANDEQMHTCFLPIKLPPKGLFPSAKLHFTTTLQNTALAKRFTSFKLGGIVKSQQSAVQLTQQAIDQLQESSESITSLRITYAGGCGAFGYRISTTRRSYPGDQVGYDSDNIIIYLDRRAASELNGTTVDYQPDEGFVLDHLLVGQTC